MSHPGPQSPAPEPVMPHPTLAEPYLPDATVPTPGPGPLATALRTLRAMLGRIWHGDPVAALHMAAQESARSLLLWWIVMVANGVFGGMLLASFIAKSAQGAASVTNSVLDPWTGGYTSSYVDDAFSVPFSTLFGVTVTIALFVVAAMVLRTVTIFWTFGVRGVRGRFRDAAAIMSTSSSVTPLLLAAGWVLSLIPGAGGALLALPVLAIGGLGVVVITEALVYIGLNRTVRFGKSPLIPHAALTVAHVAMCVALFGIVNLVALASLLG